MLSLAQRDRMHALRIETYRGDEKARRPMLGAVVAHQVPQPRARVVVDARDATEGIAVDAHPGRDGICANELQLAPAALGRVSTASGDEHSGDGCSQLGFMLAPAAFPHTFAPISQ